MESLKLYDPKWTKHYTFYSDESYEYKLLSETSADLIQERITGTVIVNGSNLILHPDTHVRVVNGHKKQLNNLADERWNWQLDDSLGYGGVIILKINRGSGEETFYRNS